MSYLSVFLDRVFFSFFALFPILNPPAMSCIFYRMTSHLDENTRNKISFLVGKYSFYVLFISSITGLWLMYLLGISIGAIKIAGGILLLNTAWKMLSQKEDTPDQTNSEIIIDETKAFYPLTLPITAGPGSISIAISISPVVKTLGLKEILDISGIITGILLASMSVYLFYRFSGLLIKKLDRSKQQIISNLSAFILFVIAVEIIAEGIKIIFF